MSREKILDALRDQRDVLRTMGIDRVALFGSVARVEDML